MVCRRWPRQVERAACLDERQRIVDSRRDPRTYLSAAAAFGPRHSRLGPLEETRVDAQSDCNAVP